MIGDNANHRYGVTDGTRRPNRPSRAPVCVGLALALSMLGGCAAVDTVEDVVSGSASLVWSGAKLVGSAVGTVAGAMGDLMEMAGLAFSDLYGDPADRAEDYEALASISGCEDAVIAIDNAARRTEISANYLLALAYQESGCNNHARASSSSAVGMFQFVEATWLSSMHEHGARYGEAELARNIIIDRNGHARVRDRATRARILKMRTDPQLSAYLAAELARSNARYILTARQRPLAPTDLYLAHFLGARGALVFLDELDNRPQTDAYQLLPTAASSNPSIFFVRGDRKRPRSVVEIYSLFQSKIERA